VCATCPRPRPSFARHCLCQCGCVRARKWLAQRAREKMGDHMSADVTVTAASVRPAPRSRCAGRCSPPNASAAGRPGRPAARGQALVAAPLPPKRQMGGMGNPSGGPAGNRLSVQAFFFRNCAMRRVKIVERPSETYPYAAVDQKTGEIPLRLPDRATLIALCGRLGWTVHEESTRAGKDAADLQQRIGVRGTGYTARRGDHRRRLGGASKYTSAYRPRGRYLGE
jgi:hypothetical protein